MRTFFTAVLAAACLAAAPGARAGSASPEPGAEATRAPPIPLIAALIRDVVVITRPFELAAATIYAALPAPRPQTLHEDPDPCAEW